MRQIPAAVLACALLAACAAPDGGDPARTADAPASLGGVVSGEPLSARIGARILAAGGNAVDAAAAAYFAMAVSGPAATLGGGGLCVVQHGGERIALDFRARAAGGAAAVPGNARGMFALHARFGALRWARVVAPAERLARLGTREAEGRPRPALALTLSRIRIEGGDALHDGPLGEEIARSLAGGGDVAAAAAALREFRPAWTPTTAIAVAGHDLHLPAGEAGGRILRAWTALRDGRPVGGRDDGASAADAAGIAAIDRSGGVAACVVGSGGAGEPLGDTGILAARTSAAGAALVVVNRHRDDAVGAATGTGNGRQAALAAYRAFAEDRPPGRVLEALPKESATRVHLLRCPRGIRRDAASCRFAADPRGAGLAVDAAP